MQILIFITAKNSREANRIAEALIRKKLAACVNIAGRVNSIFRWQGKIDHAKEVLLIAKSRKDKLPKILKTVKSLHSYEVPEIIALAIIGGYRPYLEWIDGSVG